MKLFSLFASALLIAGCSSTSYTLEGPPVRYGTSVQVTPFGPLPTKPSSTVQVFQSENSVNRPFRTIALLTREAFPRDEGLITSALIWRAKNIGADGVVLLGTAGYTGQNTVIGNGFGVSSGGQTVFRANAIVFDK